MTTKSHSISSSCYAFTPEEERYIELATISTRTRLDIVKEIWPNIKNQVAKVTKLNKNSKIQKEIQRRQEINKFRVPYDESYIIEKLMKEVENEDNRGSERIQAIVWLGKHIGMFKEKEVKEQSSTTTYNIINYSPQDKKIEKVVKENKRLIEEQISLEIEDFNND